MMPTINLEYIIQETNPNACLVRKVYTTDYKKWRDAQPTKSVYNGLKAEQEKRYIESTQLSPFIASTTLGVILRVNVPTQLPFIALPNKELLYTLRSKENIQTEYFNSKIKERPVTSYIAPVGFTFLTLTELFLLLVQEPYNLRLALNPRVHPDAFCKLVAMPSSFPKKNENRYPPLFLDVAKCIGKSSLQIAAKDIPDKGVLDSLFFKTGVFEKWSEALNLPETQALLKEYDTQKKIEQREQYARSEAAKLREKYNL